MVFGRPFTHIYWLVSKPVLLLVPLEFAFLLRFRGSIDSSEALSAPVLFRFFDDASDVVAIFFQRERLIQLRSQVRLHTIALVAERPKIDLRIRCLLLAKVVGLRDSAGTIT